MSGRAGSYPLRRGLQLAGVGAAFGIVGIVLAVELRGAGSSWLALGVFASTCGCVALMKMLYRRAEPWADGFAGERKVARLLQTLVSDGYCIFHGIHKGRFRGDIDHVVVGPTGVFAIETKAWKGRLSRRGDQLYQGRWDRTRQIQKAVHHATFLKRRLPPGLDVRWVEAVTTFTETSPPGICLKFKRHWVMPADQLAGFIRGRGSKLSSNQVEAIARVFSGPVA